MGVEKQVSIDIASIPDAEALGLKRFSAGDFFMIYKEHGVLIYDSRKGNAPRPLDDSDELYLLDVSTKKGLEEAVEVVKKHREK